MLDTVKFPRYLLESKYFQVVVEQVVFFVLGSFTVIGHNLISMHSMIIKYLLDALQNNWLLDTPTLCSIVVPFPSLQVPFFSTTIVYFNCYPVFLCYMHRNLNDLGLEVRVAAKHRMH